MISVLGKHLLLILKISNLKLFEKSIDVQNLVHICILKTNRKKLIFCIPLGAEGGPMH